MTLFLENRLMEGLAIAQSIPFPEDDKPDIPTSLVRFCFIYLINIIYLLKFNISFLFNFNIYSFTPFFSGKIIVPIVII